MAASSTPSRRLRGCTSPRSPPPLIDGALVAAWLRRWDQRADDGPLVVGQVAWIAQLATVISSPVQRTRKAMLRGEQQGFSDGEARGARPRPGAARRGDRVVVTEVVALA